MFATIFAILILVLAGWAIAKNYDAKVVLFAAGFLLMYAALIMGSDVLTGKDASGLAWADPFKAVKDLFIKQYANAGLIILTLFGFAAYMSKIGANDKVIELLSRPLAAVKSPYILVPLVFWLETLLSIIIPSAASLAVILMATLYPVLKAAKMTPLTAAGVIATTATIVPTPLGGDNVVAARVLGFDHVVRCKRNQRRTDAGRRYDGVYPVYDADYYGIPYDMHVVGYASKSGCCGRSCG